jgi:RNA polymerase sigma factor (sigma-70 family)
MADDERPAPGEVTRLFEAISQGERPLASPAPASDLLEIVYGELHAMAAAAMARERPGQTLQPTALVHEAYMRLLGSPGFENRAHFFAAAGEAMRRILIERARRRRTLKRGGGGMVGGGGDRKHRDAGVASVESATPRGHRATDQIDLLALSETLSRMEEMDPRMATIVKLRFFVGMTVDETAAALGLSRRTVLRDWIAAKAWLLEQLGDNGQQR